MGAAFSYSSWFAFGFFACPDFPSFGLFCIFVFKRIFAVFYCFYLCRMVFLFFGAFASRSSVFAVDVSVCAFAFIVFSISLGPVLLFFLRCGCWIWIQKLLYMVPHPTLSFIRCDLQVWITRAGVWIDVFRV